MDTQFRQMIDLVKDKKDCPLPIEVIPNHMGINLSSVDGISWTRQEDGQLTELTIIFNPSIQENL